MIAMIVAGGAGFLVFKADKRRAVPYPWITSLLRSLVVFAVLLLILVPDIAITHNITEKPVIVLLQDNSSSVGVALGRDSTAYRKDIENLRDKLSGKFRIVEWGFGGSVNHDSIFSYCRQSTDISEALTRANEFFGAQNLGAVVLATDGRYNQGIDPAFLQTPLNAPLYVVAIGDSAMQKDLDIAKVNANKMVSLNSNFEIRADLVATLCKGYHGDVVLKEGTKTISTLPVNINTDKFDHTYSFSLKADQPGMHHYTIGLPESEGEKNVANNKKDIFVEVVQEKKNILIVAAAPHPDVTAIREALSGMEAYNVTVCMAADFPYKLDQYSAIILHGLPSLKNNFSSVILHSGKPLWLILNNQSNNQIINDLFPLTKVTVTNAPVHNVILTENAAFNAFTLPQNLRTVVDKMPPLTANVGSISASPGAIALFEQKVSANETASPAWVLQQGEIPLAILTGEGLWRWRLYEYKNFHNHEVIDECIRQTVFFLASNFKGRPFTVSLPKYVWSDQEPIQMQAFLLNANHEQINTPDATITILDSSGKKQEFSLERAGTSYSLNIGIHAGGNYTYIAKTKYNGADYTASGSFTVVSAPLEAMQSGADYPLLYGLSKKYNGAFFTPKNLSGLSDSLNANSKIKPVVSSITETLPLVDRKWVFFLLLLLATGEWLLRKYWLAQ